MVNSTSNLYKNQPENKNALQENAWRFSLIRLPTVTYFAQDVELPGVSQTPIQENYRNNYIWVTGRKLDYDDFSITFKVDEDFGNYLELFTWLKRYYCAARCQTVQG